MSYQILFVEDSADQAELIRVTFSKQHEKFYSSFSSSGQDCINKCKENVYDAIIMDYRLPGMTGVEVLDELRRLNIGFPVVIITAQGDEKVAVEAMKSGASDYVVKERNYLSTLPRVIESVIEKEKLRRKLRVKDEFLGSIVQKANDLIFSLDHELTFQFVNPQISRLGFTEEEILGQPFFVILSDRHDPETVRQCLLNPDESNYEFEFKHKEGNVLSFVLSFSILSEKQGSDSRIIGTAKDMTETLHLHQQIRESKNKLQALFDGITDHMLVLDRDKTVIMVNEKVASLLDTTPDKVVGMNSGQLSSRGVPIDDEVVERTWQSQRPEYAEITREDKVFQVRTFPMSNLEGELEHVIEYCRDVTDQKKIERELIHSEKLATVGLLASGVAHELRNPLNIIETARYYIEDAVTDPDHVVAPKLDIIRRNVKRASNIINNLLEFSRHSPKDREKINVNLALDKTLSLIEKDLHSQNIKVTKRYQELPSACLGLDSLKQVFLNIIINAIQAMPAGGELSIETKIDNERILVNIADTGHGIPGDQISNIFTPFYTTKEIGEGTGLGMYVSHSIIKREGGDILVDSNEGEGTEFTVLLPMN
jgi:PAS domain S-box-containing protein